MDKEIIKIVVLYGKNGSYMERQEVTKGSNGTVVKMPVLFVGHGSPMNAIMDNEFSETWKQLGKSLPVPLAILSISAHWETRGTFVTAMEWPRTIHDFGGFPQELFEVQYPAPGNPGLADKAKALAAVAGVGLDELWGLDHGTWSVLRRMYPNAGIPVIQMSLDYTKPPQYHYDLARELAPLREKGVLIMGSGNMVHNLGMVDWRRMDDIGYGYDWAIEANEKIKAAIMSGDHKSLVRYHTMGKAMELAAPSPEHFLPLLYALALKEKDDPVGFFNDKPVAGSLTMTSIRIGDSKKG